MTASNNSLGQEFDSVYTFLAHDMPLLFNSHKAIEGSFVVNPNIDDEPIASFLMTYDEFNLDVPQAIQGHLQGLSHDWLVIGSFNITDPISADGLVTKSPAFRVTKHHIIGDTDMNALAVIWRGRLIRAQS